MKYIYGSGDKPQRPGGDTGAVVRLLRAITALLMAVAGLIRALGGF